MLHEEAYFTTHDSLELYRQHWLPDGAPQATLAVIHGFGEHCGRYSDFADWFVPLGFGVHSFDHRGHGKSPGKRGHINRWSEYREDVHSFLALVRGQTPDAPLFLVGHSLGGLIVLDYGLHYGGGLAGMVSSGPLLAWGESTSSTLVFLGKLLSHIVPQLQMDSHLNAADLSHNTGSVQAYRKDPLVHGLTTPGFAAAMDRAMKATLAGASTWPAGLPLLIVHGAGDRLCPPAASRQFFETCGAKDKARIEYPGFLHEVFNDVGREKVLTDVQVWLELHLA